MKYKIIFHPVAEKEFNDAYYWYEEQLAGLGYRFEECIDIKLNQITSNPRLFPKGKRIFREALVDTFPYQLVYKILEKEKVVFIVAVYHSSRNPTKKIKKIRCNDTDT